MGNGLSAAAFRHSHQNSWAPAFRKELDEWASNEFPGDCLDEGLFQILYRLLKGCCKHANDLNDKREKKNLPRSITVEFGELKDGKWTLSVARFRSHGGPWLMQVIRRQNYRDAISLLSFAHAAEFSVERCDQFSDQPGSYTLKDCTIIFTIFQHSQVQWTRARFVRLCSTRSNVDIPEQRRQADILLACSRAGLQNSTQEVWTLTPPDTEFICQPSANEAARVLARFEGVPSQPASSTELPLSQDRTHAQASRSCRR